MQQVRGLTQPEIRSQNLRGPECRGKPEQLAHGRANLYYHKAVARRDRQDEQQTCLPHMTSTRRTDKAYLQSEYIEKDGMRWDFLLR